MAKKRFLRVRQEKITGLLQFLVTNSIAYRNVTASETALREFTQDHLDHLIDDKGDDGDLITDAAKDAERAPTSGAGAERTVESTSALYLSKSPEPREPTVAEVALHTVGMPHPELHHYQVRNSSFTLAEKDWAFWGAAFPALFPYGIGSPNYYNPLDPTKKRPTQVSFPESLRHLLRLADRKYAQHSILPSVCFDMLRRYNAYIGMSIRIKTFPSCVAEAADVTEAQMIALSNFTLATDKARRAGKEVPKPPEALKGAMMVMQSVQAAARHTYGSREERMNMRNTIYGYCNVSVARRSHGVHPATPLTSLH
jgi:hypothetical protein